jgi:hypothetical protein
MVNVQWVLVAMSSVLFFVIGFAIQHILAKQKMMRIERNYESILSNAQAQEINQTKVLQSTIDALKSQLSSADAAVTRAEATLEEVRAELQRSREELVVMAYPYEEETGDKGYVVDDRYAEVGYKYQLFLKGVPCFDPHKVPVKTLHKKEVNAEKIKLLRTEALSFLEGLAQLHPAFRVLNSDKSKQIANG